MIWDRRPEKIQLRFIESSGGKNLITINALSKADIHVVDLANGKPITSWGLTLDPEKAGMDEVVEILIPPGRTGNHAYEIRLGKITQVVMEFTQRMKPTGDRCNFAYIETGDFKILGHEAEFLKIADKVYTDFLIIKI